MSQIPLTKFKVLQERISELEAAACRIRDALEGLVPYCREANMDGESLYERAWLKCEAALASTSPCPHAVRVVEIQSYQCSLRDTIEALHADDEISEASKGHLLKALKMDEHCQHAAEVKRLRELCGEAANKLDDNLRDSEELEARLRAAEKGDK